MGLDEAKAPPGFWEGGTGRRASAEASSIFGVGCRLAAAGHGDDEGARDDSTKTSAPSKCGCIGHGTVDEAQKEQLATFLSIWPEKVLRLR